MVARPARVVTELLKKVLVSETMGSLEQMDPARKHVSKIRRAPTMTVPFKWKPTALCVMALEPVMITEVSSDPQREELSVSELLQVVTMSTVATLIEDSSSRLTLIRIVMLIPTLVREKDPVSMFRNVWPSLVDVMETENACFLHSVTVRPFMPAVLGGTAANFATLLDSVITVPLQGLPLMRPLLLTLMYVWTLAKIQHVHHQLLHQLTGPEALASLLSTE